MKRHPATHLAFLFCLICNCYAQFAGVLTYHNNNARTGLNAAETVLTPSNVNVHTFGVLPAPAPVTGQGNAYFLLDGDVHAQVLYVPNVTVSGAIHNVVYVATEHDTLYALDADGKLPTLLWKVSCLVVHGSACTRGTAALNVNPACEPDLFAAGPCTVVEVGLHSTPVISLFAGAIYIVTKTRETASTSSGANCVPVPGTAQFNCFYFSLHALNLSNGAERTGSPAMVQYPGSSTLPSFSPLLQRNRPALLLANGNVYIAFGGVGDTQPYYGWVFAYKADTLAMATPTPFVSTPLANSEPCSTLPAAPNAGGIWSVGALAADSSGNLFVSTGQGAYDGSSNFGDSFLKLSGTSLAILDSFTPFNENELACNDWDAGSGSPMLLPLSAGSPTIPNVMIVGTKEGMESNHSVMGRIYLINRDNMGKHSTISDHILKELIGSLANPYNPYLLFNTPAYWNHHVYVGPAPPTFSPSSATPVSLLAFSAFSGTISSTPVSRSAADFIYSGANPTVSANGTTNGIVWALSRKYTHGTATVNSALRAFNALNLSTELYNSSLNIADALGGDVTSFTVPTIANGKVYATVHYVTVAGGLPKAKMYVFGLLPKVR
jgi:hypothetical protein